MAKAILFNGPPSSGKDVAAKALYEALKMDVDYVPCPERFANPLKNGLSAILQMPIPLLEIDYKDQRIIPSLNMTARQAYIDMSEKWMKKSFGKDIFGRLMLDRVRVCTANNYLGLQPVFLIPDSGFDYEAGPLVSYIGKENCLLVRCHRPGKTFEGDSRSYVELSCTSIDLQNDKSLEAWQERVVAVCQLWLAG
jgi:hypothetical protein